MRAQRTCNWPVSWCMAATAKGDVSPMCVGGGCWGGGEAGCTEKERKRGHLKTREREREREKKSEKKYMCVCVLVFSCLCACVCLPCHDAWPLLQRATFLLFVYVCVWMAVCEYVWDRNHCLHKVTELIKPKVGDLLEGARKGWGRGYHHKGYYLEQHLPGAVQVWNCAKPVSGF